MQSLQASHAAFSAHRDVLEAVVAPGDDAHAASALVEELQRRGKAAVGAGQWPDAAALYGKAVAVVTMASTTDGQPPQQQQQPQQSKQHQPILLAVLHANLSLCQAKMRVWKEAAASAEHAVQADALYVKGWWRLGQACAALHDYEKAVRCMETAAALEPDNKALQKERDKFQVERETYVRTNTEETKAAADRQNTTTATTTVVGEEPRSSANSETKKKGSSAAAGSEKMTMVADGDTEFTKSDHVKGYKIVNGKKTSYFHNELSEDAARLIGDIAPKKLENIKNSETGTALDSTTTFTTTQQQQQQQQGTSVWNTAGTWEEKDCTAWAVETLKQQMQQATYTFPASSPAPGAVLTVEKVVLATSSGSNCNASVAAVRGKKRYMYEFDATVHWKFQHTTSNSTTVHHHASGTMRFADIDGTCGGEDGYDVSNFTVTDADDASLRPLLTNFCHQQGLRLALHESIDAWVRLFKETY